MKRMVLSFGSSVCIYFTCSLAKHHCHPLKPSPFFLFFTECEQLFFKLELDSVVHRQVSNDASDVLWYPTWSPAAVPESLLSCVTSDILYRYFGYLWASQIVLVAGLQGTAMPLPLNYDFQRPSLQTVYNDITLARKMI